MRAEILCVGSELLLGQIIDTNAAFMATQLTRIGVDLHRKQTAGDNLERIVDCIRGALSRADALIITGGLGPTTDDLTREAIALATDCPLQHHDELEADLRAWFAARNIEIAPSNLRQAQLPRDATAIPNPNGTAPGVFLSTQGKMIFAVPGVPREMKPMMQDFIVPTLLEKMEGERQIIVSRVLRTFGVGESALAEPLEDILTTATNPTVAPLLHGATAEVHLRLTAKAPDENAARALLDAMETQLRARTGENIFGVDDETMARVVLRELEKRNAKLAVAESLTGGLLGAMLTEVSGASASFCGGAITYSNEAKTRVLNVSPETLQTHGAVSGETVRAMAEGALHLYDADFALATTGEAGPDSATGKPVGTLFVALAIKESSLSTQAHGSNSGHENTQIHERRFSGDRQLIRVRAAMSALDILRRFLLQNDTEPLPHLGDVPV